jgi:zinc protease
LQNGKKELRLKEPVYTLPENPIGSNVYFVDKPGAVQSVINVSHNVVILQPGHPDEIVLESIEFGILGGGSFSARSNG